MKGASVGEGEIRNAIGATVIQLDFWWPSAGTQLAAHPDSAAAADIYPEFTRSGGHDRITELRLDNASQPK